MKRDAMHHIMDRAFRKALEQLGRSESSAAIVDLYLFPNLEAGEFTVFDDEDRVLVKVPVKEWVEQYEKMDTEAELTECESVLRNIVQKVRDEGGFESINMIRPFSVLMVDEEMETLAELLLIDDDQLLIEDDFLKHMDKELDDFFKHLMS